MATENDLRLAWQAERDGRLGTRDVLITLAILASRPGERWAESARRLLVASRPRHWLAGYANLDAARTDPRVVAAGARLRATFPPARVERMLLRSAALTGTYTGRNVPLRLIIRELLGPDSLIGTRAASRSPARDPGRSGVVVRVPDALGPLVGLYLTVSLALRTSLEAAEAGAEPARPWRARSA